jgi:hypothetical protein
LLLTLQRGMRTAACFSFGLAAVNGTSKVLLVSAARIAASDVLVKGEDNATVRFGGGSMLEVVKVRSMLTRSHGQGAFACRITHRAECMRITRPSAPLRHERVSRPHSFALTTFKVSEDRRIYSIIPVAATPDTPTQIYIASERDLQSPQKGLSTWTHCIRLGRY